MTANTKTEEGRGEREKDNRCNETSHAPPTARHNRHTHHRTSQLTTHNRRGNRTTQGEQGSMKAHQPRRGCHFTPAPRHSTRPPSERRGDANTPTGDTDIRRGVSNTAALHSPCHPPSTTAPPSTTVRGERTEDTPPHEQHRHTPTTHTPHTRQRTVHETTAVLASTAMGRVGHEPHHCTGQDSSSTHHRHSTHRGG